METKILSESFALIRRRSATTSATMLIPWQTVSNCRRRLIFYHNRPRPVSILLNAIIFVFSYIISLKSSNVASLFLSEDVVELHLLICSKLIGHFYTFLQQKQGVYRAYHYYLNITILLFHCRSDFPSLLTNSVVTEMATRYHKTPAQVKYNAYLKYTTRINYQTARFLAILHKLLLNFILV